MQHKLKIGLLVDELNVPAWQHALLLEIANSDFAFICIRIQIAAEPVQDFDLGLSTFLFDAFQRYERKNAIEYDPCEIVNVSELLGDIDCITIPFEPGGDSARERAAMIKQVQSKQLDVILALDDISSVHLLVDASKYGVWFYDYLHGGSSRVDSSWIGFREVLGRRPYMSSALNVRFAGFAGDRTIYRSYSSVDPLSHASTRSEHLWKIRAFVPRVLRELYVHGGKQFLQNLQDEVSVSRPDAPRSAMKLNSFNILLSASIYTLWRIALKISRKFFSEKWILMFQLGGDPRDLDNYSRMYPPDGWFWADPHVLRKEDHYYIFFEEASMDTGHGHISIICMNDSGNYDQPKTILERPYHLSYPFVFEWQQNTYLIVESAENHTVEVYRCKEFPYDWKFECELMDNVSAYDATLFEHNDTWWLFANVRDHEGASTWDELCVFYSDNPLSNDWHPHPMNPVISDVRSARPAGRIFRENGRIYRPSQNSSFRYGYALNINEILELTETTYKERVVERLEPNWDRSIRALHTFSAADDLTFVDAIYRTWRFGKKYVQL